MRTFQFWAGLMALSIPLMIHATSNPFSHHQDNTIRPQDNFFEHANGGWIKKTPIPEDQSRYGAFIELKERNEQQLLTLLKQLNQKKPSAPHEALIQALYQSMMDTKTLHTLGTRPIEPLLKKIENIQTSEDLIETMAHLIQHGIILPWEVGIIPNPKNTNEHVFVIGQSGLLLPDRDYYLKNNDTYKPIQTAFQEYLKHLILFAKINHSEQEASTMAQTVFEIEHALAKAHWENARARDIDETYNLYTQAQWSHQFDRIFLGQMFEIWQQAAPKTFIVSQPSYFEAFNQLLKTLPLSDWKTYLKVHLINDAAPFLGEPFERFHFEFYGHMLQGKTKNEPRARRALALVNQYLGDALGRLFVKKHFTEKDEATIHALVAHVLETFDEGIDALTWMRKDTKKAAHQKLKAITVNVGYPKKWKSYETLSLSSNALFENILKASRFEFQRNIDKLYQPVDREEWHMPPQVVNAYYNPLLNSIYFPAAILQPPFFDESFEKARNYGSIGAIIGHEISHAFDDQGRKFDAQGHLNDWWHPDDAQQFKALTQNLETQYNAYEALPNQYVNGALTLGENIADISGVSVALKALERDLGDALSPEDHKLFFRAWANNWRGKLREGMARKLLLADPHAPYEYRTNGVLKNIPTFLKVYDVKKDDGMYLSPEAQVKIWF